MPISDSLQIVFSDSGAGVLKQAARATKREIPYLVQPGIECAHVGPIDLLGNPEKRAAWLRYNTPDLHKYLLFGENDEVVLIDRWQRWIETILSWEGPITFWFSKHDVEDMSLMILLSQIVRDFHKANVVEISHLESEQARTFSVGACNVQQILTAERSTRSFKSEEISMFDRKFRSFKNDPKGLRIFIDKEINEVPVQQQDELILRHTGYKWRKASLVFGEILSEGWNKGVNDREYMFLVSRLNSLLSIGEITRRNEFSHEPIDDNPLSGEICRTSE